VPKKGGGGVKKGGATQGRREPVQERLATAGC
jgi:hypothetical protein